MGSINIGTPWCHWVIHQASTALPAAPAMSSTGSRGIGKASAMRARPSTPQSSCSSSAPAKKKSDERLAPLLKKVSEAEMEHRRRISKLQNELDSLLPEGVDESGGSDDEGDFLRGAFLRHSLIQDAEKRLGTHVGPLGDSSGCTCWTCRALYVGEDEILASFENAKEDLAEAEREARIFAQEARRSERESTKCSKEKNTKRARRALRRP